MVVMAGGCSTDMSAMSPGTASTVATSTQVELPATDGANPFATTVPTHTSTNTGAEMPAAALPVQPSEVNEQPPGEQPTAVEEIPATPPVAPDEIDREHEESGQQGTNTGGQPVSPGDATDTTSISSLPAETVVLCTSPDDQLRQRTLELINAARAEARFCGPDYFEAAAELDWSPLLLKAAHAHSEDMTTHNFFNHMSSDGGTIGTRVTAAGYRWSSVGENIATGQTSSAMAVQGWIDSPGHCRNLMNPAFTEVALACSQDDGTDYTRYWTNVLAAPR